MEATGIYWKPIWHILEGRFELVLANATHIRNVPGRKSDVNDAVWISDLLAHGPSALAIVWRGRRCCGRFVDRRPRCGTDLSCIAATVRRHLEVRRVIIRN
jgi:hypothetical protein